MPHLLTTILTRTAVALLEAAAVRLSLALWQWLVDGGRPATAHA